MAAAMTPVQRKLHRLGAHRTIYSMSTKNDAVSLGIDVLNAGGEKRFHDTLLPAMQKSIKLDYRFEADITNAPGHNKSLQGNKLEGEDGEYEETFIGKVKVELPVTDEEGCARKWTVTKCHNIYFGGTIGDFTTTFKRIDFKASVEHRIRHNT